MTYRVEVDGVVVPESMTANAASHKDAAARVAPLNYAGKIITVEAYMGDCMDRRWFEIVADAAGGPNTVVEVALTENRTLVRLERHDD